jgi:hypothetical protein
VVTALPVAGETLLTVLDPFEDEQDCDSLLPCTKVSTWAVTCLASGCWGSLCDQHMLDAKRMLDANMQRGVRCPQCGLVRENATLYRFDPIISPGDGRLW